MQTEAYLRTLDPRAARRIRIEHKIVKKLIDIVLKNGYVISVNDGEAWTLHRSASKSAICKAMHTTDEDVWRIGKPDGTRIGKVWFVYGNNGYDVIHDYSYGTTPADMAISVMVSMMDELNLYIADLESGAA